MASDKSSPLVSTAWLAEHAGDPDIRIVDVRWRSRSENGQSIGFDDREGYIAGHIPGAVFAEIFGELSDPDHATPDMLAKPDRFAEAIGRLGIGADTLVIAYDNTGYPLGAARLWWALSTYGHDRVRVLDGGLRQWQSEGRPISTEVPIVEPSTFVPRPRLDWIASKEDVIAALEAKDTVIIDCLPPEQYRGDGENHPWGQRRGHIPGAVNVPFLANLDPELARVPPAERQKLLADGRSFTFTTAETLAAVYGDKGVTAESDVITYCGRGYAGACGMLALKLLGQDRVRLYDGSWSEWSADPNLPVDVGD